MELRVLGPLEVIDDAGAAIAIRAPRQRALLVSLALSANRVVTIDRLADRLWDGDPPPPATESLLVHVSRLRRTLGALDRIATHPGGYQMRLQPQECDIDRFERLVKTGREALAAGDPERAAAALAEGLALWRGSALADVADSSWARADVARLEEARVTALEDRVEAELACGRHASLAGELASLTTQFPLRERLWASRLLALYRTGQQAEALRTYQELRRCLGDELGLEPGPELVGIEAAIAVRDPSLDWDASAFATVASIGRHNLPVAVSSFVGRHAEIDLVASRLDDGRLVTVCGPGGIGKSRLALAAAEPLVDRFDGGVWLVELAPLSQGHLVGQAIADAIGLQSTGAGDVLEAVASRLQRADALLLLDNCEHLIDACAALVHDLLARCPSVRVLATSREPLRVDGEGVVRLGPLAVPDSDLLLPSTVQEFEAPALFVDRARCTQPDFVLTTDNAGDVADVCRRLDGLPLAIELAAARLASLSVGELAARLDDRLRLLTGGPRTASARHRTLRAAIEWSHDLLSGAEQVVFRRLAVFAGGWTLPAAEAVCAGNGVPADTIIDRLGSLVDKSLVVAAMGERGTRYHFLEAVREFAATKLAEAGDAIPTRRRHLMWAIRLAEDHDAGLRGRDHRGARAAFDADHQNLLDALTFALSSGPSGAGARLAVATGRYWESSGHVGTARAIAAQLLDRPGLGVQARGRVEHLLGRLELAQGDTESAAGHLHTALAVARQSDDRADIAAALTSLAEVELVRCDLDRLDGYLSEGLSLYRELADPFGTATALNRLAALAMERGDRLSARTRWEEARSVSRGNGILLLEGAALYNLGFLAFGTGDLDSARNHFLSAYELTTRTADKRIQSFACAGAGWVELRRGDLGAARLWFGQSLRLRNELGIAPHVWDARGMGWTALAAGDPAEAKAWFDQALADAKRRGDKIDRVVTLCGLGRCALEQDDAPRALGLMDEALNVARAHGYAVVVVDVLEEYGEIARLAGRTQLARALLSEALTTGTGDHGTARDVPTARYNLAEIARSEGSYRDSTVLHLAALGAWRKAAAKPTIALSLEGLAGLAVANGNPRLAARFFGAADAIRRASALPVPHSFEPVYQRDLDALRDQLVPSDLEAEWSGGGTMSIDALLDDLQYDDTPSAQRA